MSEYVNTYDMLLNNIHKRQSINQKAEDAHLEIFTYIKRVAPEYSVNVPVFKLSSLDKLGILGVAFTNDFNENHIYVSNAVASFSDSKHYSYLKKYNSNNLSKKEHFMHVVAHEYGHHIFDPILENYDINLDVPIHIKEACAFWFSDRITGIRSPVNNLEKISGYAYDTRFNELKKIYYGLMEISKNNISLNKCINYVNSFLKKELELEKDIHSKVNAEKLQLLENMTDKELAAILKKFNL